MNLRFNPHEGLIVIQTEVEGPAGSAVLRLALDTGATSTLVNPSLLVAVGYDVAVSPHRVEMTTGSGIEFAPRVTVSRIVALDQSLGLPTFSSFDGEVAVKHVL